MKSTLPLLTLSLLSVASPALADGAAAAQTGRYFVADFGLSLGTLLLAGGLLTATRIVARRRALREAAVAAASRAGWRNNVMRNLDRELQAFTRGLPRAA